MIVNNLEQLCGGAEEVERVIAYIDGFNLYFGLKDSNFRRFYWLDVTKLTATLLRANQSLVQTKYFTARISANFSTAKTRRQATYLDALETLSGLSIFYGHYLRKPARCNSCGATWTIHEEKMTDVRIATELLMDAHSDNFDTALLISGDSDLVPPVNAIHAAFPRKRVIVGFPPGRNSVNLKNAAKGAFHIGRDKLSRSQLPVSVVKPDGFILVRPAKWS